MLLASLCATIFKPTSMRKVLLIGSTGFVGRHLAEALVTGTELYVTTRQPQRATTNTIYFDFGVPESWADVVALAPDVIINSAGYGVVKEETDVDKIYDINYRLPSRLVAYLQSQGLAPFWVQIGTAFEYDLGEQQLHEGSSCVPLTHYGISKYLCSHFLLSDKNQLPFLILRPFAMYGPYESASKLVPYLLTAQKTKQAIALSTGEQERDYFYVKDLARFVAGPVLQNLAGVQGRILNLGSGRPQSLRGLAAKLSIHIPDFEATLWQWGKIPQRENENPIFYNVSTQANTFNFQLTPPADAYRETVLYYFQA